MKHPDSKEINCVDSLKLLGDFWTLRIINSLQDGGMRFCELQRRVDNLNPVTLTSRLKKLEDAGLISRAEDTEDKVSVCYSLTKAGNGVLPVLYELDKFSSKFLAKY